MPSDLLQSWKIKIASHLVINAKGHCFQLENWEVLNDLYSPELAAASLAKFIILPVSFEHSLGCEKFESQNFKKIKFLRYYFIFVTYLPREVDGRVISDIYFLDSNSI